MKGVPDGIKKVSGGGLRRTAIVGAGPAGFYAAERLLSVGGIEVDVFDRLPTPWGLVRAGVAPDHPKIKRVTKRYEKTAENEAFRFHGNVEVGSTLAHDDPAEYFYAVLYTTGAAVARALGIPGEQLDGCVSATGFVAWYNGHRTRRSINSICPRVAQW